MMRLVHTRRALCGALSAAAVLILAACGSSTNSGSPSNASSSTGHHGTLTAGVLHAFTGQNAFFGLNAQNACKAAAREINAGGGIMGNNLTCSDFDTKGDPADAVPVTNRMLTSASSLVMVVGPDGNDIPAVLPLVTQARIPEMNTVGDPRYDHQSSPYFWRLTPSDSTQAPALAAYAASHKLLSTTQIFTSDLSAQTTVAPYQARYRQLGGHILQSLTLAPDQASYQTEVSRVVSAHPQAIVGEMDARTAATFLTELQQQNGHLIPFVVTQRATQPDWAPAVAPAIGGANMQKDIVAIAPDLTAQGVAYDRFRAALAAVGGNQFQQKNAIVAATYDGVIAFALAMDLAKSTSPSAYVSHIADVTSPKAGATVVRTYAQGAAAIKAGQKIQYVGASGAMVFDQYHTANRPYAAFAFNPAAHGWKVTQVLAP